MLRIERARHDDLAATAALHREHLQLGLFPSLGRRFLRAYHASFADSPHAIALVARQDERVVGALFATISNADHYRFVFGEHGLTLALHGARSLLLQPRLALDFINTRLGRYARGLGRHLGLAGSDPAQAQAGAAAGPTCVLSHIVTSGSARRCGVGRRLVEEFRARARRRGATKARLVTRDDGPGAPFFERIGCRWVENRPSPDGAAVREYLIDLHRVNTDESDQHPRGLRHARGGHRSGRRHGHSHKPDVHVG